MHIIRVCMGAHVHIYGDQNHVMIFYKMNAFNKSKVKILIF